MIEISQEDGLTILTINRPDKANALTRAMLVELTDAVDSASIRPSTRAVILTGTGKVFSAGADLDEARAGLAADPIWERLSSVIAACPVLTIAALNGTAAGGALGMVLATDIRVATPSANVFYPVMALGFLPQPSDPARLSELAGPSTAKRVFMSGDKLTPVEACATGLVDIIAEDALAEARRLAAAALGASKDHVQAIKAML